MEDQIKEIKKIFEKLKELTSGEDKSALLEKMEELEENWKKFGDKLNDEINSWEKEREDVYELKDEKIKNFRRIAEEFGNKLNEEVDSWEKEREDVYELKDEKIKNFRRIAEEFKN